MLGTNQLVIVYTGCIQFAFREAGAAMGEREYLRRVTFDLTGLPPSPGQVESFLKDESLRRIRL